MEIIPLHAPEGKPGNSRVDATSHCNCQRPMVSQSPSGAFSHYAHTRRTCANGLTLAKEAEIRSLNSAAV